MQLHFRAVFHERWVLKAPAHMHQLEALLTEYADALIVLTHRDLMKVRDRLGRTDQFADLRYGGLRADPVGAVEGLYEQSGPELTAEARALMRNFIANQDKSRHGHGRHAYSMADYGFTEAEIE